MNSSCQLAQDSQGVCMVKFSLILFKLCEDKELLPKAQWPCNTNPYSETAEKINSYFLSSLSLFILCSQLQISEVYKLRNAISSPKAMGSQFVSRFLLNFHNLKMFYFFNYRIFRPITRTPNFSTFLLKYR